MHKKNKNATLRMWGTTNQLRCPLVYRKASATVADPRIDKPAQVIQDRWPRTGDPGQVTQDR